MAWAGRISERFRDWRNRKIADPEFRRRSVRFPLTRPVARHQTSRLFGLVTGFVHSQVLFAFVEAGLVDFLAKATRTESQIARHAGLSAAAAGTLMRAAAALDLAEARTGEGEDASWALGPLGAALVKNDGVEAMIRHHAILYDDLRDPMSLLRGERKGRLGDYWNYREGAEPDPDGHVEADAANYSRLMGASQSFIAAEVLAAWPFARHRTLLDVGGGDGTFALAALEDAPHLHAIVFDLPQVASIAQQRIADAGLAARAVASGGSFLSDPLPAGADLVTLNRVLHDHDDEAARAILASIRRAIAPGGTLLICEPMAQTRGAEAAGDAYFGFYLLAMGRGRPRPSRMVEAMLLEAGFKAPRPVPTATPMLVRMMAATAA